MTHSSSTSISNPNTAANNVIQANVTQANVTQANSPNQASGFVDLPIQDYERLLTNKVQKLTTLLEPFADKRLLETMSIYASDKSHFRMRAEFGVWHEGDDCFYTMVSKDAEGNKQKIRIDKFAIATVAINECMQQLMELVKKQPLLKQRLFQVEFLSSLSGDMLITLIYHKKLDDNWLSLAQTLESSLGCSIIGRSRKQKVVVSKDHIVEKLTIAGQPFFYKQLEGGFTQPNAKVCQHMLTWACNQAKQIQALASSQPYDLLELYCGNANFTLPLSQYFQRTLATEISKTSVAAAQWNIAENHINNIAIARLSAEEFTEALTGTREFRRLAQAGIELATYQFSTIFVDPPRAGIDANTLQLMAEFEHIIYISCNPDTLADNLQTLSKTHQLKATALFDQFPYTHHIEAGVWLQKIG